MLRFRHLSLLIKTLICHTQLISTGIYNQHIFIPVTYFNFYNFSNYSNIAFYYANGTQIPSWLQNYSALGASWWLLLYSIPGNSYINISVEAFSSMVFNGIAGANPLFSSIYGQYDNGHKVFNGNYLNFSSSSNGFNPVKNYQGYNGDITNVYGYGDKIYYNGTDQYVINQYPSFYLATNLTNNNESIVNGYYTDFGDSDNPQSGIFIDLNNSTSYVTVSTPKGINYLVRYGTNVYLNLLEGIYAQTSTTYLVHFYYLFVVPNYPNGISPSIVFPNVNKYVVTFTESGLPSGYLWGIHIIGYGYNNSTSSSISFSLANGTYNYQAVLIKNYYPSISYGQFSIKGSSLSISISFYPGYSMETHYGM